MVTRMLFQARSIMIFETAANCSFFFTYLRISRSLCRNPGSSCGEAYQRERQSRFTPRRNPIGLTFCPINYFFAFGLCSSFFVVPDFSSCFASPESEVFSSLALLFFVFFCRAFFFSRV